MSNEKVKVERPTKSIKTKPTNPNYNSMHIPSSADSQQPRIRITSSKAKPNTAYYSCPTKKLMEDEPGTGLPSMNAVGQLPSQEIKLNEHPLTFSSSNVRVKESHNNSNKEPTPPHSTQQASGHEPEEAVNFSTVKISDLVGGNTPKSKGLAPDVKRVRLHKKSSSDQSGIAPDLNQINKLKEIYQTERQSQAESFLLDFIASDETTSPKVKAYLMVKSLNEWFSTDLMNNIIKSCESSIEKHQLSRKKVFCWASTIIYTWAFSRQQSSREKSSEKKKDLTNKVTFRLFVKKIEATLIKAFDHTWTHFTTNMEYTIRTSISEGLRRLPDDAVQHSSLDEALQKLLEYTHLIKESLVFASIERQFVVRIFQWIMNTILSTIHEGAIPSHSIQMNVIISELTEFGRKIGYQDVAKDYLSPANEISNMLCYQNKHLLADKKERQDVCPTLSPRLMASVLENYSQTNKEAGISKPYLEELRAQESRPDQETHYSFKALDLNFEIASFKAGEIVFPAQFIERPGFEFLQS